MHIHCALSVLNETTLMIVLLVKCTQLIGTYRNVQSTIVYKRLLQQQSHCEHSDVLKDLRVTLLTTRTAYTTQTDLWVLSISIKKSSLLENCNRYRGTYISISSKFYALLFYVACTMQVVLCSLVVYFALALYFTHRSCLLAHQNAVTVLSVLTLSH